MHFTGDRCCKMRVRFPDSKPDSTNTASISDKKYRMNMPKTELEKRSWTFGSEEYDRRTPGVRLSNIERIIEELDHFKIYEMQVHEESLCNTLTYRDAADKRGQYTTNKMVFLSLQKELMMKYEDQFTVANVLEVCRLDSANGRLVVA